MLPVIVTSCEIQNAVSRQIFQGQLESSFLFAVVMGHFKYVEKANMVQSQLL